MTNATPATTALSRAGIAFTVHGYQATDRARDGRGVPFGVEVALAMGVDPRSVFKTLLAEVDGALWVAVVPVPGQLDLKALAAVAGGKRATMAEPGVAERSSGYVVGGISPIGQRRRLPIVVDDTALALPVIYVSGGRRGLDIGLAPADLVAVTGARTAPISSISPRR